MSDQSNKRYNFYLPVQLKERADKIAKQRGGTITELVRLGLEKVVEHYEKLQAKE